MRSVSYEKLRETSEVSEATRRSMCGNRPTESKPEVVLRRALWRAGLRGYRKNVASLPGKPDVVYVRARLAVFVHGCFWHGCPTCTAARRVRTPKTNSRYWEAKVARNQERYEEQRRALSDAGWGVLAAWECEVKSAPEAVVAKIAAALRTV